MRPMPMKYAVRLAQVAVVLFRELGYHVNKGRNDDRPT